MDEAKASLFKKLATVMGDMNNIPKTGVNSYFKYKFVTAEAIADAVRQRLASQNVAFFASISKRELVSIPTGKTDKNGEIITVNRWVIDFEFTFADGDTGATDTRLWSAEAGADDDKGINKCATAAEKYFFLKTFIVNTGDEPDADGDGTQQSPNGVKKVTPAQPSAAVRGAGVRPAPAPSPSEPDPIADFGAEQGADVTVITATRPDEQISPDDYQTFPTHKVFIRSKGKKREFIFQSPDDKRFVVPEAKVNNLKTEVILWASGQVHDLPTTVYVEARPMDETEKDWDVRSVSDEVAF